MRIHTIVAFLTLNAIAMLATAADLCDNYVYTDDGNEIIVDECTCADQLTCSENCCVSPLIAQLLILVNVLRSRPREEGNW